MFFFGILEKNVNSEMLKLPQSQNIAEEEPFKILQSTVIISIFSSSGAVYVWKQPKPTESVSVITLHR